MELTFPVFRGSANQRIIPDTTNRKLGANEVYIETTHSGLCGTDEHFMHNGLVLGHEGIGIVKHVGPEVTSVRVGDRVGFGYVRKTCRACNQCLTGWSQYCPDGRMYLTHDHDLGSLSHGTVWDADWVFPIPDGYDSAYAAPLLCAGATVWTCLTQYNIRPGQRVGVLGIGGVGHMAIKLANAIGCHVVVFSRTEGKRQEALDFGAAEFHLLESFEPVQHLLVCGQPGKSLDTLVPLMANNSTMFFITAALEPIEVSFAPLIQHGICIQSSFIASRQVVLDLLGFAARKKIYPTIMEFPLTQAGIEEAMQMLKSGKIRYRAVLHR
ncbi:NAD(P)-dependent alcohol dehydrogenase [Aspergillus brunneoviolaceus CBS 621.78]|uniref:Alcohol dehydrogenase n=1 Tax=Aspergillus brunneoviolaceus CBS 621.78 TaxID=1450534 RepID=A0ACD1GPF1_9EURO|nr:alcohol dehydrogenase [Aspergillus brunneoviolaceus CBS 621.78]RAH51117.1 alcohol dehydrogenase [Aspergillus brunneoviolaceus CBS 621.78]